MFRSNNFTLEDNTLHLVAATIGSIFENCPPLSFNNQPGNGLADKAG